MFYTKYRPQTFSQISRPNQAADALSVQIQSGKTAHAYLFVGPRGTGKTTAARILAKALNCEKPLPNGDPCGECTYCTQIQAGNFTDLIEIDAASNRGIDDIRSLREKVKLAPTSAKSKIYIIDETHMLTTEAFNALLKTLEEPPKHVVFILCTTEEHKVPETIKSRCQVFNFSRATLPQLVTKLALISEQEGFKVFADKQEYESSKAKKKLLEADLRTIAKNAHGGFRDAETMLEQFIESGGVYLNDGKTTPEEFVYLLLHKDLVGALHAISDLYEQGKDMYSFSASIVYVCRDLLLVKSEALVTEDESVTKLAESASLGELSTLLDLFLEATPKVKTAVLAQLPLELATVKFCSQEFQSTPMGMNPQDNPTPKAQQTAKESAANADLATDFDTQLDLKTIHHAQPTTDQAEDTDQAELTVSDEELSVVAELLEELNKKWADIITTASQINNSVTAILKACRPVKIDGGYLVLEVMYKFHKERLEASKNRELVEQAIHTHLNGIKSIKCVVSSDKPKTQNKFETGELTDMNISPVPQSSVNKENATGFFDGGLPIV